MGADEASDHHRTTSAPSRSARTLGEPSSRRIPNEGFFLASASYLSSEVSTVGVGRQPSTSSPPCSSVHAARSAPTSPRPVVGSAFRSRPVRAVKNDTFARLHQPCRDTVCRCRGDGLPSGSIAGPCSGGPRGHFERSRRSRGGRDDGRGFDAVRYAASSPRRPRRAAAWMSSRC